ncbi:MAG: NAD-dependent epimerase/dehydratase family protein [Opitutales bacterium]
MPSAPQRLFVTGGRGRLASLIADHFRAPAHDVTLFSHTPGPGFRALADLTDDDAFTQPATVLHLAWSTLPATSEQRPRSEWASDLPMLEQLLAAMSEAPASGHPHLVFFSTGGAVYGNAPGRACVEEDPCRPIGHYGRAKRAAEELVEAAVRAGLPCTILRISNPYGYPVPRSRAQGIIPHALRCAMEGTTLTLWGDGSARKDFLYYTDFLSALEAVVARRLTGVYNLSAGESHTIQEVLQLVEAEVGRPVPREHIPAPAWDVHDSRLDNTRLVAATGWRPQVSLREGIRRAAAGYVHH